MIHTQTSPSTSFHPQKAVFLDRDGVINQLIEKDGEITSPKTLKEFVFLPNVFSSIEKVQNLGYKTFIVTNQPGILEGKQTWDELDEITKMLLDILQVDGVYNSVDKNSVTYKPNNGMLEYFIKHFNLNRHESYIVGDRWKDIVPGHNSGINTIYVGKEWTTPPEPYTDITPGYICSDILEACNYIAEIDNER